MCDYQETHKQVYNYSKHKHISKNYLSTLSDSLKKFNIERPQTYYPLLDLLFKLNDDNHNNVCLEHRYQLHHVETLDTNASCTISCLNNKTKLFDIKKAFIKFAPLTDPFKYLCGKTFLDTGKDTLPVFRSTNHSSASIIQSPYNPAYVDSFFSYLTSQLKNDYDFQNGLDYYGNVCCIKDQFKVGIDDELSFLNNSSFFMLNRKTTFGVVDSIDDNDCISRNNINTSVKSPIKIDTTTISFTVDPMNNLLDEVIGSMDNTNDDVSTLTINGHLREVVFDNNLIGNISLVKNESSTNSQCSSRTSYTTERSSNTSSENDNDTISISTDQSTGSSSGSYGSECESNATIYASIDQFPVNMIFLEQCKATLDDYIENNVIDAIEMKAILSQIILSLAVYQHCFDFSHNDLHTNNIMYVPTKQDFIYFRIDETSQVYKVPTFGKLWKIIDFGRSVYKIANQTIENTCYSEDGDATTQYNFGKLYSDKYTLREPNKNFDLCRLACSLFDYFLDSDSDSRYIIYDETTKQLVLNKSVGDKHYDNYSIENLILKWLTDGDNHNILYKSNGEERYPGFKLYKMIAVKSNVRCCPFENIKSAYFDEFVNNAVLDDNVVVVSINSLPVFYVE